MGKTFQSDLSIDNKTINNEFESRKRRKKRKTMMSLRLNIKGFDQRHEG